MSSVHAMLSHYSSPAPPPLPTSRPASRASPVEGPSTRPQPDIIFDSSAANIQNQVSYAGSKPPDKEWNYQWKYTPSPDPDPDPPTASMGRYLSYPHTALQYKLDDPDSMRKYIVLPSIARRISAIQEENGVDNKGCREARRVARIIYTQGLNCLLRTCSTCSQSMKWWWKKKWLSCTTYAYLDLKLWLSKMRWQCQPAAITNTRIIMI